MATTNRNELELFILRELQSINDDYDNPFTQEQVDTIVKFIATDYDDRRIHIRADIAAEHLYHHIPRFVAYGYLNQLLEILGQNSPLSILENHVESFTFLIRELKGYFDGALWLLELESFVRGNEKYVREVEATNEFVKEIFEDRLKSVEDEKKLSLVELQVANALSNCPLESEEEMTDDALIEYLVYSDVIKCVFEKDMEDVRAMMREVQLDMKPDLEFDAKYKLDDLEFHLFAPNIIRKKKTKRSVDDKVDYFCKGTQSSFEGTSKGSRWSLEETSKGCQSSFAGTSKGSRWSLEETSKGCQSSFEGTSKGSRWSLEEKSKGCQSSFEGTSKGSRWSLEDTSKGSQSSLEDTSKGSQSSLEDTSKGSQSYFGKVASWLEYKKNI